MFVRLLRPFVDCEYDRASAPAIATGDRMWSSVIVYCGILPDSHISPLYRPQIFKTVNSCGSIMSGIEFGRSHNITPLKTITLVQRVVSSVRPPMTRDGFKYCKFLQSRLY